MALASQVTLLEYVIKCDAVVFDFAGASQLSSPVWLKLKYLAETLSEDQWQNNDFKPSALRVRVHNAVRQQEL